MKPDFTGLDESLIPTQLQYNNFLESCIGTLGVEEQHVYWKNDPDDRTSSDKARSSSKQKIRLNGKQYPIRRVVYAWFCGKDDDMDEKEPIYMHCKDTACVNPVHMVRVKLRRKTVESSDKITLYNGTTLLVDSSGTDSKNATPSSMKIKKRRKKLSKEKVIQIIEHLQGTKALDEEQSDLITLLDNKSFRSKIRRGVSYSNYAQEYYADKRLK